MHSLIGSDYQLIYADPPWSYGFSRSARRRIENHYPTMALADIMALPVAGIAAPDALLVLWGTTPKLPEAFAVMGAWGFNYVTSLVWDKVRMGPGYYGRVQHEHLLIGKRGAFPPPPPALRPRSIIQSERRRHSQKPDEVYDLLEAWYPHAKRIELFARSRRKGWHSWGDEVGDTAA